MKVTSRAVRRIAAVALGGVAVLAPAIALAAASSPARPASSSVVPFCETPGLVIWFNPNGRVTGGLASYHLRFTNLSGHACSLNGFPFLYAINLRGHQVGRRAAFTGHVTTVTIKNGGTVHSVLGVSDVFFFPKSKCRPVTAAGFKVFPPNQTRAKTVPFPFPACSTAKPVFLHVGPLHRGL
jgi:hypothetical protein